MTNYKGFDIDLANDDYENYIIYDLSSAMYLENSPVFYTVDQAKAYIDLLTK